MNIFFSVQIVVRFSETSGSQKLITFEYLYRVVDDEKSLGGKATLQLLVSFIFSFIVDNET